MIKALKHTILLVFVTILVPIGQTANVALLLPGTAFTGVVDPNNDELDRTFLLENLELERGETGLHWLILHLENDLGHTVNFYNSDNDVPADVEDANDLIIISEALGSGTISTDYVASTKPVISFEMFLLDEFGFTTGSSYTGGAESPGMEIQITDTDHPITQGLPETFSVTVDDPETGEPTVATFGVITDLAILTDGDVLATLPTSVNHSSTPPGAALPDNLPMLIVADVGSSLGNDVRWVFFGYSDVPPNPEVAGVAETRMMAVLSEPAIQLLDNAIAWALGEDISAISDWDLQ